MTTPSQEENVAIPRVIGSLPMTEIDRALRHTLQN